MAGPDDLVTLATLGGCLVIDSVTYGASQIVDHLWLVSTGKDLVLDVD